MEDAKKNGGGDFPGLRAGGGFFIPIRRFPVVGGKQSRGKSWFLTHGKKGFYDGGITL